MNKKALNQNIKRWINLTFVLQLIIPIAALSQVEIGKKAPEIHLESIYNCNKQTSFLIDSLKGKIIVLDFWATWCAPCVAAFPEYNKLSAKYKDQNVVFLSITDDPKKKLENFLKKVKIDFCVGQDENKQNFESYKVNGRPAIFIINRQGIVVFRGNHLTEENIIEVINTNSMNAYEQKNNKPKVTLNGGFRGGEDPYYNSLKQLAKKNIARKNDLIEQFIIRPSLDTISIGQNAYRIKNEHVGITSYSCTLEDLFVFLHELSSNIWIEKKVNDSSRYDIVYWRKKKSFEEAIYEIEQGLLNGLSINFDTISSLRNVNVMFATKTSENIRKFEQIEEGTEKAYTSINLFISKLEQLSKQLYITDNTLNGILINNQGMEWKKLHNASSMEIIDFLKSKGIIIKQQKRVITTYAITEKK